MTDRKYFFFDIDGTLTDDRTHLIVPSARKALSLLRQNGHFVAIATGRAYYKTRAVAADLGVTNLVCYGGGSLVIDGELKARTPLDHEKLVQLLDHAEAEQRGWLALLEDSDQVIMKDYRFLEQAGLRREPTTYVLDPSFDYHAEKEIYKIYLAVRPEEEAARPWLGLLGKLRMTPDYFVFQYDAKKDGILRLMQMIGGPISDVVVFGDDVNDLVMFDPRWTSIAMGNGKKALQDKADYVTAANTDDGILKACLHFGWIREDQV
jgi:HAD superfamily hydrolase (TIGR01484 family)